MLASDVTTDRARVIFNDTDAANYRVSDSEVLDFLNDGVQLILDMHPEEHLTDSYTRGTYGEVTATGHTIGSGAAGDIVIRSRYRSALVDYVCSRVFEIEAQNRSDMTRAVHHSRQFAFKAGVPMAGVPASGRRG
jgi:hypothetical protein